MHPVFGEAVNESRAVNALDYTRRLGSVSAISMLVVGGAAACLVTFGKIPDEEHVPFIAVLIGFVLMAFFYGEAAADLRQMSWDHEIRGRFSDRSCSAAGTVATRWIPVFARFSELPHCRRWVCSCR